MRYLFDTNIILTYLKDEIVTSWIEEKFDPLNVANEVVVSAVTVGEIKSLALRNKWGARRITLVEQIMEDLIVVDVAKPDLFDAYAEIETYSLGKHPNKPVNRSARILGKNDLWIAATAFLTRSILLTTDKDFLPLDPEYLKVELIDREAIRAEYS